MRIFITGTAGFIGFHLAGRLLEAGHDVVGIDGFTPYYDIALKERRAAILRDRPNFRGHRVMLEDKDGLAAIFAAEPAEIVIHLAAQAGVRYSIENPRAYLEANIVGTFNLMDLIRQRPATHFLFASTSSVYGANRKIPFAEIDPAETPLTFYAATKRATEHMAHSYSHLWEIPTTGLRFFTVYGPWGRPDMAPYKFVHAIAEGRPIQVYNQGNMSRDFTYVADIVEAIVRLIDCPPAAPNRRAAATPFAGDSLSDVAPFRILNIGGGAPVDLMHFIATIENRLGCLAQRDYRDMQPGDMAVTYADTALLEALTRFRPQTPLATGIEALVEWYRNYRGGA